MAGSIGDLLMGILGRPDPRKDLLASVAGGGGTQTTPQPTDPTQGGAGGGAGPTPPAQATAYTSPAELVGLYEKVMERDRSNRSIDSGAALIAASMAQEDNRPGLLAMSRGGSSTDAGATTMMDQIMQMNAKTAELATKNRLRGNLPALAKRYGLDDATASYLFETGELDAVIKELEKPDRQIVQDTDGRHMIVDKRNNTVLNTIGTAKSWGTKMVDAPDGKGGKVLVWDEGPNKDQPVGGGAKVTEIAPAPLEYELKPDGKGGTIRVEKKTQLPVPGEGPITQEAQQYETKTDDQGNQYRVYKGGPNDQKRVNEPVITPGSGSTDDLRELRQINHERELAGQPPLSTAEFLANKEKRAATGIVDQYGNKLPEPEPGFQYDLDEKGQPKRDPETGAYKVVPFSGGTKDARKKEDAAEKAKRRQADIVTTNIDKAIEQASAEENLLPTTGIVGDAISGFYQPGADLAETLKSVEANVSLDKLNEMRQNSTTGASGLGQVTDSEHKILQAAMGSLKQRQSKPQFIQNLRVVQKIYQDVIDGVYSPNRADAPAPKANPDDDLVNKWLTPQGKK